MKEMCIQVIAAFFGSLGFAWILKIKGIQVLYAEHLVAHLDVWSDTLALVVELASANGNDLAALGLLLRTRRYVETR